MSCARSVAATLESIDYTITVFWDVMLCTSVDWYEHNIIFEHPVALMYHSLIHCRP
jgi:hypothetical protein